MTTQTKYPFKFLDAYKREDRDIFFGREAEVDALYQMVFQTDLILVYGASGTGKTSLIQCGLASRFQPYEWLALSVRRGGDLNESLEKALAAYDESETTAADRLDWLTDAGASPAQARESLAVQRLKNLYLRQFKPVFLIFDQFEELYILGSKDEQDHFVDTVRDILRMEQPVKVLLSIREEYLGYLYEFERKVPELLRKKLRIEPMNLEKVQTVVQGISRLPYSNVHLQQGAEAAIGEGIFKKLKEREYVLTIELPYLQVFLDKLYLQITGDHSRQSEAVITEDALQHMGDIGDVLRNFLDDQVQENARALRVPPDTVKKLLAPFVTLDGTKEPLSADQLHARLPALDAAFVGRSLQAFQNSRILRFDEREQRYEVAHDSLARQIATYRDAEDIALQTAAQILRTQMLLDTDKREMFSEKQLLFLEPYLPKLDPSAAEQDWLEQSRAHWETENRRIQQENKKKLDAAQRQAEIERELRIESDAHRAIARQNETRARTALAQVEKEKAATEEQRQAALKNFEAAEKQRELADARAKEARAAFEKQQASLQEVVRLTLVEADRYIYDLDYDAAHEKIRSVQNLGVSKQAISDALLELAFWYAETGQTDITWGILDTACALAGRPPADRAAGPRAAIRALNPDRDRFLEQRYFPVMVEIPGGKFRMGEGDEAHDQEVSSFQMARTETTWWQYMLYCAATGAEPPEAPGWGMQGDNPVVNVSWYDAVGYVNWLSRRAGKEESITVHADESYSVNLQKGYRLPTEAEWEYAAGGGSGARTEYAGTDSEELLKEYAWYYENSGSRTRPVGALKANALGLYDMSGNVWEWCWDWYGDYPKNAQKDYAGPGAGDYRVYRGGSWGDDAGDCRVSYRNLNAPDDRDNFLGFRPVSASRR